ncbi:putative transcriptional adaptor ADA2 [Cryptosporidium serpentis]
MNLESGAPENEETASFNKRIANVLGEDIQYPEGISLLSSVEVSTLSELCIARDQSTNTRDGRPVDKISKEDLKLTAPTEISDLSIIDGKFRCDICKKDTWEFRIRCAECIEYDLCLECFCEGKTSGEHQSDHAYIPIGRYMFNLLIEGWTAEEELLLMEAVSRYGLGNWSEISKYITEGPAGALSLYQKSTKSGSGHSADECERHYNDLYLSSATKPLPDTRNSHKLATQFIENNKSELRKETNLPVDAPMNIDNSNIPVIVNDEDSNISTIKPEIKQCNSAIKQRNNTNSTTTNTKPNTSVIGYMPLRGDFDVEYDNDAELLLADMEFRDNDTPQEKELKLQILEIYNSKLDERIYRKRFVIERNLLDIKSQQQKEKKRTKEERELYSFLKPLSRFQTEEEQDKFVSLLIEEKRIRNHLQKVQEWCSLGIRTLDEVRRYEEEKRRREDFRSKVINLVQANSTNSTADLTSGNNTTSKVTPIAPLGLGLGNVKVQPNGPTPFVYESQARSLKKHNKSNTSNSIQVPYSNSNTSGKSTSQIGINLNIPIENYPGASLLTETEKQFCDKIQLAPIFYILAKRILLQEARSQLSGLSKDEFSRVIRLDGHKAGLLYDFCLSFDIQETQDKINK